MYYLCNMQFLNSNIPEISNFPKVTVLLNAQWFHFAHHKPSETLAAVHTHTHTHTHTVTR